MPSVTLGSGDSGSWASAPCPGTWALLAATDQCREAQIPFSHVLAAVPDSSEPKAEEEPSEEELRCAPTPRVQLIAPGLDHQFM